MLSVLVLIYLFFILSLAAIVSSGEPPTISEHPLDILVAKDDPATLRCEAEGEGVEITWYKDSEPVKVGNGHRLLLPDGSLLLLKVKSGGPDSDAGVYYCVARNKFGDVRSQEANLRVAMLRDEFRINPHSVQALIGNRVTLDCLPPKGFPEPVITWRKDEREVNTQNNEKYQLTDSGNLNIENAQKSDAGFYQCVATNSVGERISKPARLSVYEKPKFLVEPRNVVAEVNSSVLFECKVTGEPLPTISWKKRDGQMPIGRAYVARDRGGLRIDRVQPQDSGEYICFAKNPVGNVESSAHLHINSPPLFTKLPQNLRLTPGKTAIFECEAFGQPIPRIFWSKEGDQLFTFFSGLVSSDGRIQVTNEGRLIIDNIRQVDQGIYVCAAANSAGSTLAKASLFIISDATSHPPPIIQYGHQNQTLMLNDMAILPCQATGRLPVTINWMKDDMPLNLNSTDYKNRYRQQSMGTLQISDLKKEDSGIYTCKASSEDGETTWTSSLVVEEHTNRNTNFQRMPDATVLPSSPGRPNLLNISDDGSVELEWTAPERQGASPIVGYIIQYWSPEMGESWQNIMDAVSNTRFRIKNLRPGRSYIFLIRAENSKGIGLPSLPSSLVTINTPVGYREIEERETSQFGRMLDMETARQKLSSEQLVKLIEVRPLNSSAMLLSWKRQKKEPLVQGYYIKWRGPPLPHDHSWVNVTDPEIEHIIINGLRPFNNYEFFVIPYHYQIQGMPSNSLDGTTMEASPTMPPSDVRLRMLNISSLRISWRPPPTDHINGILKGFLINIKSNHSSVEDRNITTNERATSVTLYRLIPNASYAIRVAARTNAGVGIFFDEEPVVMNEETLHHHIRMSERLDSIWYRQPWAVLGCGILLWCLLLLVMIFFWYKCCHRGRGDNEKEQREFIKIRDGSVCAPNTTVLGDALNAFWSSHEQQQQHYNAGTVETFTGTLVRGGGGGNCHHLIGHNSSEMLRNGHTTGNELVQLGHALHHYTGKLHLPQRFNPDGSQIDPPISPNHHYHYTQLPDNLNSLDRNGGPLSTFARQQKTPPKYYDDPSPYATTTLINPEGGSNLCCNRSQGPSLPLNPAPTEPPRHFLSSAAVMRPAAPYLVDATKHNNFNELLDNNWHKHHQQQNNNKRIAAATLQQRRLRKAFLVQHQHFGTTSRGGGKRNSSHSQRKNNGGGRSKSVATSNRQSSTVPKEECFQRKNQQQESPQTEISYVHSSEGTNNNKSDGLDEAPQYDPVMTESIHQLVVEASSRRRKREERDRTSCSSARNRVSLIEDEEHSEQNHPLIENGIAANFDDDGREELDADGELSEQSDEYVSSTTRSGGGNKESYYDFSPAPNRPSRQPMMGVNISTLSSGRQSS